MRPSPSIVPDSDQNTYLVLDDVGLNGRAWREADVEHTRLENVIPGLFIANVTLAEAPRLSDGSCM